MSYSKYYWQNDWVRLRPATADDWDVFYLNFLDSQVYFFLDNEIDLPLTENGAREYWHGFIGRSPQNGFINFTVETLDGQKIGLTNLHGVNERHGSFGADLVISRDYRGKGYGFAAMRILLSYAFNERRLHKYSCFVIQGNKEPEKMLKKLGCIKEGVIRETVYHMGEYLNEIHYGITAEEFNKHNPESIPPVRIIKSSSELANELN